MRLPPFELERFFADTEFDAPHHLSASDCESMRVAELLDLEPSAAEGLGSLRLGYTRTAGAPGLREEIASLYDTMTPSDVLVHAAGEEAIFTFMHAALEPGDHVIVHHPSYQSLAEIPRAIGCQVTLWEATARSRWRLDLDFLRDHLRPATRAVVVNLPHSPTGYLMTAEEWRALLGIVRGAGVLLFSDEAYRGLEYEAGDRLPAACDLYEGGCSLGLLSKGYGLPGLRIAWLATRDADLLARIARVKDYTTICASAPSEFLARIALRHTETLLSRSRRIVARNLAALGTFMKRHGERFAWVPPAAGPVTFPTYLGLEDVEAFCAGLLREAGVLLLPGTVFTRPSRELRFGIGRLGVPAGLQALDAALG